MVHGLQGDDPKYWQAASLMKHLLANSHENGRSSSSSDFDKSVAHYLPGVVNSRGANHSSAPSHRGPHGVRQPNQRL